jgi:predicted ester cyclase
MKLSAKLLAECFYNEVWNRADETVAREILEPDFRIRAGLGPELRGPEGFIAYLRFIHAALGEQRSTIEDMVSTDDRAAARLTFTGIHRGVFFEKAPTGRRITWPGSAFFKTAGEKIVELWVLGDIDSVKQQIGAESDARF